MSEFNPYHQWLGISETERPISKYRLLGIDAFEDNRDVISAAAERQTVYLRTLQAGEHAVLVAELLNEVSQARITLLNADQKAAYDEELRKRQPPEPVPEPTPIPVVQTPAPLQNIPLPTLQTSTPFATPQISITTPRRSKRRARGKVFKVAVASVIGTVTVITLILALSDYSRTPPKLTREQLLILEEERVESYQLNQKQVESDQLVDNAEEAWKAGNYLLSDRLFKEAIAVGQRVDGNLWNAYHSFSRSYEARGDYPNALIQTRNAISASDDSDRLARSTGDEGVFLFRIGDHEEGQVKLEEAIEITPHDFWNVFYMGRELRLIGKESEALPYLEQAVSIDRFQGIAQLEIARILTDREEYLDLHKVYINLEQTSKEALANHGEAGSERIRGIVESPWYWDRRAFASSKLDNWQDVLAETERGLAIEAEDESDESLVGLRTMANQRLGKTAPIISDDANSATRNSGFGNLGSLPKSLTTGLLLYLPLDGKYAFADPGDQNDHQLKVDVSGAVLTEDRFGRRNGAYRFDGKDDRIVVEYGGLPTGDSTRSIAVSFHASGIRLSSQGDPNSENLVSLGDGTVGLEGKRFSLGIQGEQLFLVGQHRDHHFEVTKIHDQWCTYIVTFKGEIGKCYVNGMLVSQFEHKLDTASAPLVIGSNTLSRNGEFFKGIIDEVLVYDRAMSLTEIKALDSYLSNKPTPKQATTIQELPNITNTIGMKLNRIPAGTFMMGSPVDEPDREDNEHQHKVTISKPFYMQTTEVTQGQWKAVMGTEPWKGSPDAKMDADHPAVNVSWGAALQFCSELGKLEEVEYRLPTEAEWEYACRAGTTTMYSFGNDVAQLGQYAWHKKNASAVGEGHGQRVGQKLPNPWGLYDMHGNVWEWCQDLSGSYGEAEIVSDPVGMHGRRRVLRGGSFQEDGATFARSATRSDILLPGSFPTIGFRVVRVISQ